MLQVVKRNGKKVAFDENKISAAILKAMDSPSGVYIKNQPEHIAYIIKEKYEDVDFVICNNDYEKAIRGSDIIVTAISGQDTVLKAKWIDKANFYVHVGGLEDEYEVAFKADKIVCDEWDAVKHRGSQTISKMYQDGLLKDEDIYAELFEILLGKKEGRSSSDKFIYFNSVGMSYVDVLLAKYIYDNSSNFGKVLDI